MLTAYERVEANGSEVCIGNGGLMKYTIKHNQRRRYPLAIKIKIFKMVYVFINRFSNTKKSVRSKSSREIYINIIIVLSHIIHRPVFIQNKRGQSPISCC